MTHISLKTLTEAAMARIPQFRDKKGKLCHPDPEGKDWSPAQWLQAVVGELGEYANVRKKFERGDLTEEEFNQLGGQELSDVLSYFVILCRQVGVDIDAAVIKTFNNVSDRVDSSVKILSDGWYHEFDWDEEERERQFMKQMSGMYGTIRVKDGAIISMFGDSHVADFEGDGTRVVWGEPEFVPIDFSFVGFPDAEVPTFKFEPEEYDPHLPPKEEDAA